MEKTSKEDDAAASLDELRRRLNSKEYDRLAKVQHGVVPAYGDGISKREIWHCALAVACGIVVAVLIVSFTR